MTPEPTSGLTKRPLTVNDARAVYDLMAAQQHDEIGRVEIELADIVSDWQRPSFDVPSSTLGFFDGDRLVAYAEHCGEERGDAAVHPDYRGKGLGTQLAQFMQDTARARGAAIVGMPVPEGKSGDRTLADLGYYVRWHSWVLQLPEGASIPDRALPSGYLVRAATPAEVPQVHQVIEDAFLEWSQRDRQSLADFEASTVNRPGHEPWMLRVVTAADGAVAAAAFLILTDSSEVYVDRLATRSDQRNRGLAQALLVDSFATGRAHGATTAGLATDSRTGALGLYQKVGMVIVDNWVHRAINL